MTTKFDKLVHFYTSCKELYKQIEMNFDKKHTNDWVIEGPREINRHSVIAQGHYAGNVGTTLPTETFKAVNDGRAPHLLMDIHNESEVNLPSIRLSEIDGPSQGNNFNNNSNNA